MEIGRTQFILMLCHYLHERPKMTFHRVLYLTHQKLQSNVPRMQHQPSFGQNKQRFLGHLLRDLAMEIRKCQKQNSWTKEKNDQFKQFLNTKERKTPEEQREHFITLIQNLASIRGGKKERWLIVIDKFDDFENERAKE